MTNKEKYPIENMDDCDVRAFLERQNNAGKTLSFIDLEGRDLAGIDLRYSRFYKAKLKGANLQNADLKRACFELADMRDVNLKHANLRETDFTATNLSGADLRLANLDQTEFDSTIMTGVILPEGIPTIKDIHTAIYTEVAEDHHRLYMGTWHGGHSGTCGSTHCRAGWVIALAGEKGVKLENKMSPWTAAALIYQASDPELERIPLFYGSSLSALKDIKEMAEKEQIKKLVYESANRQLERLLQDSPVIPAELVL